MESITQVFVFLLSTDTSRTTSRGYHKVQTKDSDTDKKVEHIEESEEEDSDDSCFLDTDSEYGNQ